MMPTTAQEVVYVLFNFVFLALLWYIRKDLKGLRDDIKQNQRVNNWLRHAVLMWHGRCSLLHPDKPMPPLHDDPDNN